MAGKTLDWNFAGEYRPGRVVAALGEAGVQRLHVLPADAPMPLLGGEAPEVLAARLRTVLDAYFSGHREDFINVLVDLRQGTVFQRSVWEAARSVTWGATASYGDLSALLGLGRGHARAVGQALGANPVAIIIPCHRFLGARGDLVNYAGGLEWKRALLALEGGIIC